MGLFIKYYFINTYKKILKLNNKNYKNLYKKLPKNSLNSLK